MRFDGNADLMNGGFETGDLTGWTATGPVLGSCGGCAEPFVFISQGFDEGLDCGCVGNRQKALASTKIILVR